MGKVACDAKTVLIHYRCDKCNRGLLECIDSTFAKDSSGESHMYYTHKCTVCGEIYRFKNLKFPYPIIVPTGDIRELDKKEETPYVL